MQTKPNKIEDEKLAFNEFLKKLESNFFFKGVFRLLKLNRLKLSTEEGLGYYLTKEKRELKKKKYHEEYIKSYDKAKVK
jgi:hypothetical protein